MYPSRIIFQSTVKKEINDYDKGYPTLIDGANNAPPEDVGGLPGFYDFLKKYNDPEHTEHEFIKSWAEEQKYREYNEERINEFLKLSGSSATAPAAADPAIPIPKADPNADIPIANAAPIATAITILTIFYSSLSFNLVNFLLDLKGVNSTPSGS